MAEPEMTSRPSNDAYTGMLAIALLALIGGSALMYLDYSQYPTRNPPGLPKSAPAQPKVEPPPAPKVETPDEKKDEPKKDEAKKDEPKKEEMKKEDEKKDEKKEAEKKDEKKESSSLGSPRFTSPLLELGIGVAQEDAPVVRRRRMDAFADVVSERRVDELTDRGSSRCAEAG
jgi:hypothetical protein